MAKPAITVAIKNGLVANIDWPEELNNLFRVVVKDFDDPDPTCKNYRFDENDAEWHEQIWEDPS